MSIFHRFAVTSRDRLEVRTLRCGRNNPGSNPGHGTFSSFFFHIKYLLLCYLGQYNLSPTNQTFFKSSIKVKTNRHGFLQGRGQFFPKCTRLKCGEISSSSFLELGV